MRGVQVGSIHLNVFRPFPDAAVIRALAGKQNVIVLERTDEPLAGDNPMGRDIRTALAKALQGEHGVPHITADQMPRLFGGIYGLGSPEAYEGMLEGSDGQVQISASCVQRGEAPVAIVVMQPVPGSASLAARMAASVSWPEK